MLRRGKPRFNGYMIYPAYLDSKLSRKEGRRLSATESIENPSLLELKLAAEKMGWVFELNKEGAYSKEHWNKRGLMRIEKMEDTNKTLVMKVLAKEIRTYVRPRLELLKKKEESEKHKKKVYTGGKQPKKPDKSASKKQQPPEKTEKDKKTRRR